MSERILTLFGEEILPEPAPQAPKNKGKKKQEEKIELTPVPQDQPIISVTEPIVQPPMPEVAVDVTQPSSEENDTEETLPDDWKGDKQYYAIGEVATLLKVKTSNVRFWTNEFKLKVRTTRKGDRLYTEAQIKELKAIYHLVKERGFTLNGAKTKLKTKNNKDVETVDLKTLLTSLRGKLVAIKNQLK
jgi:DNA-binding transcriptional MerR regulator